MSEERQTTPEDSAEVDSRSAEKPRASLTKRLLKLLLYLVYLLVLAEIGSRAYWAIRHRDRGMPFFAGQRDWIDLFYNDFEDSGVWDADLRKDDEHFDVLFLGGSALDRVHLSLAKNSSALQSALAEIAGRPVRVFNMANPGMSSRDSLTKYKLLAEADKRFDLIVVYHAINDARMNCCPRTVFRNDYTHCKFNKQYDRMRAYGKLLRFLTFPYSIEYAAINILASKTLRFGIYLPRHRCPDIWIDEGTDIKTAEPFRANLQGIVDLARSRSEPVLIMTQCWYIPGDYSQEKLKSGKLDYAASLRPSAVELWGSVRSVSLGVTKHNEIIRDLARRNGDVLFVDADAMVPKEGRFFNDVCHLSEEGKLRLMESFLPKLRERLAPRSSTPAGQGEPAR